LRLYPPVVTFITRELGDHLSEVSLSRSGVTITKEMSVQINLWTIHHDEKHWPEPYRFNPFRENLPIPGSAVQNNFAFLPYGFGPRSCLGVKLADSEAR